LLRGVNDEDLLFQGYVGKYSFDHEDGLHVDVDDLIE
jgi:hypothetical protein